MFGFTATERAKALRKRHIIRPTTLRGAGVRCEVDLVRIHPIATGWRHDVPEMVALNAEVASAAKVTA